MNISKPYTIYTPGAGYTGYLPGCDRPALRSGKEFLAQETECRRQIAANKAETASRSYKPGVFDPDKLEDFERKEPTEADIAELVGKYDPEKMTQEEYDAFLEDLVDAGILSEYELGVLGYDGLVVVGSMKDDGTVEWSFAGGYTPDTKNPEWDDYFGRYGLAFSLEETKGNALAYAKLMTLWKPAPECSGNHEDKRYDAFTALANVLETMQAQRK